MKGLAFGLFFSALLALGCSKSATSSSSADGADATARLLGTWVVDLEGSKQLDPGVQDRLGYFLILNKDGSAFAGSKGQELALKWEAKGETPEGKEVWLKGSDGKVWAIYKLKSVDADHLELPVNAYGISKCRLKRVAELPAGYKLPAPLPDAPKAAGGAK